MGSAAEVRQAGSGSSRARTLCIVAAAVAVIPAVLVVLGALVPSIPVVGSIGTVAESSVTLHIVLVALVGAALAYFTVRAGAGRFAKAIAILGVAASLGSLVPLAALAA